MQTCSRRNVEVGSGEKKTTGTAEEIGDRSRRNAKRAAERLKQSQCCPCCWKTPLSG